MSEQAASYPANWQIATDFNPNDHMMSLKGKEYLSVQHRLVWFVRDQRALIAAGLATHPYATHTELVELDRDAGWAHFKTTVRDVLGNESTAYGSESVNDFGDYIEKAATKSLGRALVGLGYGTGMAPEMDEGERVVDAPLERRQAQHTAAPQPQQPAQQPERAARQQRQPAPAHSDAGRPTVARDAKAKASAWVTTDGYDPLSDMELRAAVKRIGILSMADFETFLRDAQGYRVYDHAAINATLTIWEARHEQAQATLAAAGATAQEG
jgi:hypothetical protein